MNKCVKVVVTGAAGQIGYALLFRIASGQMFGPNVGVELNLLELEQALPSLEGVVMELEDCAFPLLKKITYTADLATAMSGVNWALLVGSVPRKQGMERGDLLKVNGGVFTKQGKALNDYAADDIQVFVVGNPCNTNCLIAKANAPDILSSRFYAMTSLDELRARAQLANKAEVDILAINQMTIWGNHSATQYPDFYNAKINGKPASTVIKDESWAKDVFVPTIQQRGAQILKMRGLSSAASAANAIIYGVNQLTHSTLNNESFSMALSSSGEYGVDEGLMFSFPCRCVDGKVEVIEGLTLQGDGPAKFALTLNELREERLAVKSFGLI